MEGEGLTEKGRVREREGERERERECVCVCVCVCVCERESERERCLDGPSWNILFKAINREWWICFQSNLQQVERLNKLHDDGPAVYGVTKFSDLSQEEFKGYFLLGSKGEEEEEERERERERGVGEG